MARPPRVTSRRNQRTTRAPTVRVPSPSRAGGPFSFRSPTRPATPPAAPATPATPAAPAAPQYSLANLPVDASYDAAMAALQRQRDDQLAQLVQQRASTLLDYGFKEGPNGTLAVDPSNPFSKAALLKKSFDTNRRATGQSLASGGQLYSGAFQNAQDLVSRNQLQAQDQMQKALGAFLVRNTQGATQARTGYELAAQQAYADRVGRFQTNPNYDPASLAANAAGATPGPSTGTPAPVPAPVSASSVAAGLARRRRLTGARIGRI